MMFAFGVLTLVAGGLGAVARFLLDTHLKQQRRWSPLASLALINTLGSIVLGVVCAVVAAGELNRATSPESFAYAGDREYWWSVLQLALVLCTGFTTFSSVAVELAQQRAPMAKKLKSFAIAFGIPVLGFSAAFLFVGAVTPAAVVL